MKVDNLQIDRRNANTASFKGPLVGSLTRALMTIDTNEMINCTLVDVGAMVIPRTYIDTKERNDYAGFETFFREITGTVIMCLSSGPVALGVAGLYNRLKDKDINISPKIWAINNAFDVLKHSWLKSNKDVNQYVETVLSNMSGLNGREIFEWKSIEWSKVQWFDDPTWNKIQWKDTKWKNIIDKTKNGNQIITVLSDLIKDTNADKKDVKKVFSILEHRIANSLQVSKNVDVLIDDKKLTATLKNIIRDTYDLGKSIFNTNVDLKKAEAKLKSMNKVKSLWGVGIVAVIGLTNQYVNRLITKKRTGKDKFVGYQDFAEDSPKVEKQHNNKSKKSRLLALKALASAGMLALYLCVVKIKNPAEFIKKLEFTGCITSGNAIKTLYATTLIGRFLAARDENELRESCTRDYFAFLNWLVFGGFVAKGTAQLLFDHKQKLLFNLKEDGSKGIKRWLYNVSLKSHAEIASKGSEFAKKNVWKINVAHIAGLLYSGLALGCAIPLINIILTKKRTDIKKTDDVNNLNPARMQSRILLDKAQGNLFAPFIKNIVVINSGGRSPFLK